MLFNKKNFNLFYININLIIMNKKKGEIDSTL